MIGFLIGVLLGVIIYRLLWREDLNVKNKTRDSLQDVIVKMSDGNPGALNCLAEMTKYDWSGDISAFIPILSLDHLELYGSKIYMLWNDCCDRDMEKVDLVLRNWQMGNLSKEEIHNNLNQGYGTPFENLKSFKELLELLPKKE